MQENSVKISSYSTQGAGSMIWHVHVTNATVILNFYYDIVSMYM